MSQPCHSCLAPPSRHLLPCDMPKTGRRAEPPTFLLFVFCLLWGTDAEEDEKRKKIYSEQVPFIAGGSGIHGRFGCRRVVSPRCPPGSICVLPSPTPWNWSCAS